MDDLQAMMLLTALGCRNVKSAGEHFIVSECPFAKWFHENKEDNAPSFVVRLSSGIKSPRFLKGLAQFRKVFDSRVKFV